VDQDDVGKLPQAQGIEISGEWLFTVFTGGPGPCFPQEVGFMCQAGLEQVPLDKVDLSLVSLLYIEGNMAAITPIYDYDFQVRSTPPKSLGDNLKPNSSDNKFPL
jgi:hypothetical protein